MASSLVVLKWEKKSHHMNSLTYYLGHQADDVLDKWHRKVYNLLLGVRPTDLASTLPTDLASALPTDLANGPNFSFPKNTVYYNRPLTFPLPFPEMASRQ